MGMTDKELRKFAHAELVKRRPRAKEWEISADHKTVRIDFEDDLGNTGVIAADLTEGAALSFKAIADVVVKAIRESWPKLADCARVGTAKVRIAYTYGEAQIKTIVVQLQAGRQGIRRPAPGRSHRHGHLLG